jgi:CRP-like cAMP-binding protein
VNLPHPHPHLRQWIACCLGRGRLAPLGAEEIEELAEELGERRIAGGMTVFRAGERPAKIHVVREGTIELTAEIRGRRVSLQVLRPGDMFGDIPLLLQHNEHLDARAIDDSVVLSIDAESVSRLVAERPRFAQRWLVSLAERAMGCHQRLLDLLAGQLDARVASLLLHESARNEVKLSQARIADLVGSRRSPVNQILKRFEANGWIELGYRQVRVIDPDKLGAVAGRSSVSDDAMAVAPPD